MATTKWTAPTNVSTGITGNTINDGAGALGSEYDNETNLNTFAAIELTTDHASSPAGGVFLVYFIVSLDGTNYEEGGTSTQPSRPPDVVIHPSSSTAAQEITVRDIPIPPFKFKPLVWNDTGVNSDASAVILDMEVYNYATS